MGGAKLDWDRLKVFQTVAETGSINAAAKALCRSYTKVSNDLHELERALGHQLFERSNRGLELTVVGEDIVRSARSMADTVQTIVERARERSSDHLVICAREGIATYWLARRLPELLQLQPDVRVFLKVLPTTPNLAEGDGDIAIQFEKPSVANVVARQLGWLHYILYAAPSYLAQYGEPKAMSDLQAHQCLRLSGAEYQPESWRQAAAAWGAILPDTVGTDAGTVLMEACASGAGIAALPSYVSQFDDRLTPLTDIKPLATVRFWMAYTERARNMEASQPVLHWIRSCFDPVRYPCFREIYVPPQRRPRTGEIANDVAPGLLRCDVTEARPSAPPAHRSARHRNPAAKHWSLDAEARRNPGRAGEDTRLLGAGRGNPTGNAAIEKR